MSDRRVVITGMGTVNPLGHDVESTWSALLAGASGISRTELFDAGTFPSNFSAQVKDYDFASQVADADRHHSAGRHCRFALGAAVQAWKQARLDDFAELDRTRVGIYLGSGEGSIDFNNFTSLMVDAWKDGKIDTVRWAKLAFDRMDMYREVEQESNMVVSHLAAEFDVKGPAYNVLTACAASTQAIGEALMQVRRGDVDVIITGGAHSMIHPYGVSGFIRLTALSTRNDEMATASRPFDMTRNGFVIGEGASILILEEYQSAVARGASILAEVIGYGSSADAFRITDQDPEGDGAATSMRAALADAKLTPGQIDYISAHGTATKQNDQVETLAVKAVFGQQAHKTPISSVKSMLGHLIAAAGATELITCVLAIRDQILPPTMNYKHPDPECDLDYVPNAPRKADVKTCMSNSFGFGGQNNTLIITHANKKQISTDSTLDYNCLEPGERKMKHFCAIMIVGMILFPPLLSFASQRQYVLENNSVKFVFDDFGRVVEIYNKQTSTQYLAGGWRAQTKPPFIIDAYSTHRSIFITDPILEEQSGMCFADPKLLLSTKKTGDLEHLTATQPPDISIEASAAGQILTCKYSSIDGIGVSFTVLLPPDGCSSQWQIEVNNEATLTPAKWRRVYRVLFPVLGNLRISDRPERNMLARPFLQGELIPNPSRYSFTRPDQRKRRINILTYPGWASMPWQDLYIDTGKDNESAGLYFASYDPTFQQLDIETVPDSLRKTITMSMRTFAFLEPGEKWQSQKFIVAAHTGDWHWAADKYRKDSSDWLIKCDRPGWLKNCHGWYGSGRGIYSYPDLLEMYDSARWLGFNYLQCWGQMWELLDYYCFLLPDPNRGGEEGLTEAIKKIRQAGGHVGFYANFWIWDASAEKRLKPIEKDFPSDVTMPRWQEFRKYMFVWPDGHINVGNYEDSFSGACSNAKGWQEHLKFWVADKYVKQYGVDAWYFDSFPVSMFSAGRVCFSPEHTKDGRPHPIGQGLIDFVKMIREQADPTTKLAVTSESVNDVFMQYQSHVLGLELIRGLTRYPRPEIYTYTFPDHLIFSGSCNAGGTGLQYYYKDYDASTANDARMRIETFNRVFLMGYRFDCLDYPLDKNYPPMSHLRGLVEIREKIKDHWYNSSFKDDIGLGDLPENVYAKVFRHNEGKSLTIALIDRRPEKAGLQLSICPRKLDVNSITKATAYLPNGKAVDLKVEPLGDGKLKVHLPSMDITPVAIVLED